MAIIVTARVYESTYFGSRLILKYQFGQVCLMYILKFLQTGDSSFAALGVVVLYLEVLQ